MNPIQEHPLPYLATHFEDILLFILCAKNEQRASALELKGKPDTCSILTQRAFSIQKIRVYIIFMLLNRLDLSII